MTAKRKKVGRDRKCVYTTIAGKRYKVFQPIGALMAQKRLDELREEVGGNDPTAENLRAMFQLMLDILRLCVPDLDLTSPEIEVLEFEDVFTQMSEGIEKRPLSKSS